MTIDPHSGCQIGQGFGGNYNPSYASMGLNGHPAIDESCGFGSPIKALASGLFYSAYFPSAPAKDGYTAIYTLCETPLEIFELSYGHVSAITIPLDTRVKAGDVIGKEGNRGLVYSGNVRITLAMQAAGDKRGAHRHIQKRPLLRGKFVTGPYLQTANGVYFDDQGYYYQHALAGNGYAGCVDWTAPLFNSDLQEGMRGYNVTLLQRALVALGYAEFQATGYFRAQTKAAVKELQKAQGIQTTGTVGPKTRAFLNSKFGQLA